MRNLEKKIYNLVKKNRIIKNLLRNFYQYMTIKKKDAKKPESKTKAKSESQKKLDKKTKEAKKEKVIPIN